MTIPLILRPSPFSTGIVEYTAMPGETIEAILRAIPGLRPEVWTHGVVRVGDWEIPRDRWHLVRPKAGSRQMIHVGIRLGDGGGGGGGGKNPFVIIAAIALVVVATAITGGALGPAGFASISSTLFAAGSTSAALAAAGVSVVGSLALNALAPVPAVESSDRGETAELGSASSRGNALGMFSPIPFVAGTHRVAPPHIIAPWSESVNDDQFVNVIYALNGAHLIEDILINEAPIAEFPDIEYEVRDVLNDDTDITVIDKQVFENSLSMELSSHKLNEGTGVELQDAVTPANSYPKWHVARARSEPGEIWLGFFLTGLFFNDAGSAVGVLPLRISIRRLGTSSWINLPEFWIVRERQEPFRATLKLRFQADPGGLTRVDQDDLPPWGYALYVTNANNAEGFDVNSYFTAAVANNAVHVGSEDGTAVVYLDPGIFAPDVYDIRVMRGQAARRGDIDVAAYKRDLAAGNDLMYLFTHVPASSPPSIRFDQAKAGAKISWQSMASVWNDYPLGEKGLSLVAVRAKNTAINSLTVLATGYAGVWNGADWSNFEPTRNPAAWWRALALGQQSIRAPFVAAQLDGAALAEWFDFCGNAPAAAAFDGSAAYLTRGAGLSGAADSKLLTYSVWLRPDTHTFFFDRVICGSNSLAGADYRTRSEFNGSGAGPYPLVVYGFNAANGNILTLQTSALPLDTWTHVLVSVDLANPANRHVYLNGVSDAGASWPTYTNDTMDFTLADWSVGAIADGSLKFTGGIAELWFQPGLYVDLSIAANRRKFITAEGRPAGLGPSGNLPTGSAPLVYLSGQYGAWHTNKGTGGGFTEHGALTPARLEAGQSALDLECNAFIDGRQSLGQILQIVAANGRAAGRISDKVGVVIERDRTADAPIQLFSQRNSRGLAIRRAFPRIPHGFRVRFNDAENQYKPAEAFIYRRGFDAGTATEIEAITYVGITDSVEAKVRAQLDFDQLQTRGALYNLEADIENLYCTKGSLVALSHDTVSRHHDAARVASVQTSGGNVTGLTLDTPLRLQLSTLSTDFADDTPAAPPEDWSSQWAGNTTANVTAQASLPSGKGPLLAKSSANGDAFWAWGGVADAADVELLALIRPNADSGDTSNAIGLVLRGAGANGTQTGYRAVLNSNSAGAKDRIEIGKWVSGAFTFLANAAFNWVTGANYYMRFQARGTSLKVKVWAEGSPEPGAWNVTVTDADVSAAGKAGAYTFNTASSFYVGSFAVAVPMGLVMQLKDGSTLVKELVEIGVETAVVTFVTPFAIPAGDSLEADCLAACGPFSSAFKRMLVLGVQAQSDYTAALTLIDEAPEINQRVFSPEGDAVLSPAGDYVFAPA